VPAPSMSYWKIAYSPNMPAWMSGTEGNWYFDFPNQDGVHYVYKVAPAVRVGQTITMHFAIASNGSFVPTEGTATARVQLFLEQQGDTLRRWSRIKRWWSVTSVELHKGEFTLTASLSPDQWTSVFGQGGAEVPNEFNAAISQVANVGFTFGGAFAGHGVYVTGGNARFILKTILSFAMSLTVTHSTVVAVARTMRGSWLTAWRDKAAYRGNVRRASTSPLRAMDYRKIGSPAPPRRRRQDADGYCVR
jgi:hypothetical protein